MIPKRKVHPLIKALVAVLLLAGLGFLFVRSARDSRSEPYQLASQHMRNWALGIDTAPDADGSVISLRPPAELPMNLFRQLFSRQMESMGTPSVPGIALVLQRELPAGITAGELLNLAREAGLEQATLEPRCVGYRRVSATGVTRQLYFVHFNLPGFDRFRRAAAQQAGAGFDPAALSPVMIAAAQPTFAGWLPIVVNEQQDCIAPIELQ